VVAARRETESQAVVDEISAAGGRAVFVRTDVTVAEDVQRMVGTAVSEFGRLDCAFNNAGGSRQVGRIHEYSEEDWDHYSDTFLKSVWRCMKHELEVVLEAGRGGAIVNNASVAGLIGTGSAAYSATKHGVVGLTRSAGLQYAEDGVRVNAVCPGWIHTEMTETWKDDPVMQPFLFTRQSIQRPGAPEEIASMVLWMCSDEASFVTGAAFPVDGGLTATLGKPQVAE
jgi:NAD(P)-dependent dehydrogenase (short-subunit alcohol dehydrogenase family)